jgi:hypothetical protein
VRKVLTRVLHKGGAQPRAVNRLGRVWIMCEVSGKRIDLRSVALANPGSAVE